MQRDIRRPRRRRLAGISVTLVCATWMTTSQATDYGFGYWGSYNYPYDGLGVHENLRLQREIDRMSGQMRRQQQTLDELQQEQARYLRQQQSAQMQITAKQACYYRYDGGLDLCDRLFETTSERHAECVETVVEMNPGCAEDIERSRLKSRR